MIIDGCALPPHDFNVNRTKETLINRRSREVVGDVGGEWPDTEAKRRPFGEVCLEDAPYFSHFHTHDGLLP